ncbi:hypothetical protein GOBAR_DD11593 [Gossypium barbadense]|nr:hypothetical protein GOBAR_DD11593 [Gossypium barbadense]
MFLPPVVSCIASYKPHFVSDVDNFVGWGKDITCFQFNLLILPFVEWRRLGVEKSGFEFGIYQDLKRYESYDYAHQLWLWIKRNNFVLNDEFIEGESVLEKSYQMMDNYLQSNCIKWIPPEDEWHKGALDGLQLAWNLGIKILVLEMDGIEVI